MHTSDYAATGLAEVSANGLRLTVSLALALLLVVLWLITHRYPGIDNDAQLYAFQALVRIHPALGTDLYLQNGSQDQYTIFSPFYVSIIRLLGLQNATLLLTVSFAVGFFAAAWTLARDLTTRDTAWLAAFALTITSGAYGAAGVFQVTDNYLTPRPLAEALVSIVLVCYFRGMKRTGLIIAIGALFVHPLMALPGLLLLICVWMPSRARIIGTIVGVLAVLSLAIIALTWPLVAHKLSLMDADWLDVVRERSHFLLLQQWTTSDWVLNARPFICLSITILSVGDERIRRLSVGALLVGAAGLAVAYIGSGIAPIAILIQGQAWRWVWVTTFISILLLAPTVLEIWRDERCGPICAILLVAGWTCSALDGTACVSAALILWLIRAHITPRTALYLRWTGYAVGVVIAIWALANAWTIVTSASAESGREPLFLGRMRNVVGLGVPAVLLVGVLWQWIRTSRSLPLPALAAVMLLTAAIYILPKSYNQVIVAGSAAQIAEFGDWRNAIPETSNVLIADKFDSGSFVWFTLGRPNYLSVNQSAGVVFSRKTALEVRRRSEVVLPLMDPDWKLLTIVRKHRTKTQKKEPPPFRPLTAQKLLDVCSDPQLGFVIAEENVGFDPVRHAHPGPWKDWNLYDCHRVRSSVPQA
jgi:hypothetical protein